MSAMKNMFARLDNLQLKQKLLFSFMLTGSVSLVLSCLIFTLNGYFMERDHLEHETTALADTLARVSNAALSFDDKQAATEILDALKAHPNIDMAVLYRLDSSEIARYLRTGTTDAPPPLASLSSRRGDKRHIDMVRPVREVARIGTIYLRYDLSMLVFRLLHYLILMLAVLLLVSGFTYVIALRLMNYISAPVQNLVEVAHAVSLSRDYSIRAVRFNDDEIGTLSDGFNDMLSQIQARDNQLVHYYELLEMQVATRTRELQDANAKLSNEIEQHIVTEEELKKSKIAADAANRSKSVFLANMSHEIRTPMNAILGFAQVMQRDTSLSSDSRDYLGIINRSGEHLLALINDILELSKIEVGRATCNASTFDLHKLIADIEMMLLIRAKSKRLYLLVEKVETVPRWVVGDEGKLRQILINILGNAVKFTDEGGVSLRFGAKTVSREKIELRFEVEDTGPGIPEEDFENLFKAFEQASSGIKKGGTGLGLAICKGFLQMMDGAIEVGSTVGKGSIFLFTLPVMIGVEGDAERQPQSKKVLGLMPGQEEIRILIVDDIQINRLLLANLFMSVAFTIREAGNGAEAVTIFQDWHPRIILMDVSMPVMDGYEATRAIKRMEGGGQTTIIAITASAFQEDRQRILEAGADGYLAKPFKEWDLFETIRQLTDIRYVYDEDAPEEEQDSLDAVSDWSDQIAALPSDLRNECIAAAETADVFRLQDLFAEMAKINPAIVRELDQYASAYEFEKIVEILSD